MNESQINQIINGYLIQSLAGLDKENPKLDFKATIYNLKDETEINEFLKDSSAIANTPGLDGFLVLGYNEKDQTFKDCVFSDCGLKDSNELIGLLIRRIDRVFQISNYDIIFDNHKLCILHIPPSFDKPHVIKKYKSKNGNEVEHRVFIKHESTTRVATKYDYDFINYDRKNNTPEYSLHVSTSIGGYNILTNSDSNIGLNLNLTIENNGLRPVAINEIVLKIFQGSEFKEFMSALNYENTTNKNIKISNFTIQAGSIENYPYLLFRSIEGYSRFAIENFEQGLSKISDMNAILKINTGRSLELKVEIIK